MSPPVAGAKRARGFLHPGHSGGTAPASHRTSLDHRPYLRGRVYCQGCFSVALGDSKTARATVIGIGSSPDSAIRSVALSCSS